MVKNSRKINCSVNVIQMVKNSRKNKIKIPKDSRIVV
jgi:hypothetical protein